MGQKEWPPLEGLQDIQHKPRDVCWQCGGFGYIWPPHIWAHFEARLQDGLDNFLRENTTQEVTPDFHPTGDLLDRET